MIHKITPFLDDNSNQNLIKVFMVVKPMNKKTLLYKCLGLV